MEVDANLYVAHTLKGEGFDAGEDGTGRGTPLIFDPVNITSKANRTRVEPGLPSPTMHGSPMAVAFDTYNQITGDIGQTLQRGTGTDQIGAVMVQSGVRRLTPRECERLQGFPDDYTLVQYKGKPMADGPRYRMLGNSMAVNVMGWIGQRIRMAGGVA